LQQQLRRQHGIVAGQQGEAGRGDMETPDVIHDPQQPLKDRLDAVGADVGLGAEVAQADDILVADADHRVAQAAPAAGGVQGRPRADRGDMRQAVVDMLLVGLPLLLDHAERGQLDHRRQLRCAVELDRANLEHTAATAARGELFDQNDALIAREEALQHAYGVRRQVQSRRVLDLWGHNPIFSFR
jgi:hypothetical protein